MPPSVLFINTQFNDYEDNNLLPSSELELNNSKCTENENFSIIFKFGYTYYSGLEVRFKQNALHVINAIGLLINLKMKLQHIKYYTYIFQLQLKIYALK